jgi:hypothetical protein
LAGGAGIFFLTMNSVAVVMGMPEALPIAGGLGAMSSWGWGGISEVIRMVRRGQCYVVDSKHSIDFKTQFVAHVLFWYTILPKHPFINK